MIKRATSAAWALETANEGEGEPSPVSADAYWENISLQASARLAKLEEERKQHAVEDEVRQPPIAGGFAWRTHRLVLMAGVGAILFAVVAWLLLKAVPTAAALLP